MFRAVAFSCVVFAACVPARAGAATIEPLNFNGLYAAEFSASINAHGDIAVDYRKQGRHGVLVRRASGLVTDISAEFRDSVLGGIADNGDVVYWGDTVQEPWTLVRRTFDYQNDATLLVDHGFSSTPQSRINASGMIATIRLIEPGLNELIRYMPDGSTSSMVLAGPPMSVSGIGPNGSVIVRTAEAGSATVRELLPDGTQTPLYSGPSGSALDMNAGGRIVGWIGGPVVQDHFHGMTGAVWTSGEYPNPLRIGPVGEAIGLSLTAINNHGLAIGDMYYDGVSDPYGLPPSVPILWSETLGVVPLQSFLESDSGWELQRVIDLNDNGQIVGVGVLNGSRAVFMLQIPAPASSFAFTGAGLLLIRRRR